MARWNGPWTSDSSENGFTAWSLSRYLCFLHGCVPIRCCVCPCVPCQGQGWRRGRWWGYLRLVESLARYRIWPGEGDTDHAVTRDQPRTDGALPPVSRHNPISTLCSSQATSHVCSLVYYTYLTFISSQASWLSIFPSLMIDCLLTDCRVWVWRGGVIQKPQ